MLQVESLWTNFCRAGLDALYPPKCALCRLLGESPVCLACADGFLPAEPQIVYRTEPSPLAYRAVIYRYEERAAQAVRRLKYGRSTSLAGYLAHEMKLGYTRLGLDADIVIPVPIHWSRRCQRGFNQAELLCAEMDGYPEFLTRVRRTQPQVGLTREQRIRNLDGAFRSSPAVLGKCVLLVDDVLTSGQTAVECAKSLRSSGASEVGILALCGEL